MARFVKIATDVFPVALIEDVNLAAQLPAGIGVEVKLRGEDQTFQYTGEFAEEAFNELVPLADDGTFIKIATDLFPADRVVWANLAATINGLQGVELALEGEFTTVPDAGSLGGKSVRSTRQYTGDIAKEAYAALVGDSFSAGA